MEERDFLLFRLAGPMAAWGDIAVGERRGSWDIPSKSAVIGLLAAGLGLDRRDTEAHAVLDRGLGFGVRQDAPGRPLRDYHTAQAPKARKNARWGTRRDELAADDLNTVLSDRIYRIESAATVAVWARNAASAPSPDTLENAVRRPHFALYLGRKACPLSRPPRPRIVRERGLIAALDAYDGAEYEADLALNSWRGLRPPVQPRPVWFEVAAGLEAEEAEALERRYRRDGLMNRALWQFADRLEGRLEWRPPIHGEIQGEVIP
ncbi:MAG: type I-E CRISPR-associated protein Cas5/CasD [Alphaproteobacteria bacterium]|nr:type I-E CRISPR-associated protein Cas5/CasD [Alphaproteobacteria bacterium]